jgi:hypothetical protein
MPTPPVPNAGDAVRLMAPAPSMPELAVGKVGILDGILGHPSPTGGASIIWNPRTYRDDTCVRVSGGPGTIWTPYAELRPTGETVTVTAWRFKDDYRAAANGVDYTVDVPLWEWYPGEAAAANSRPVAGADAWETWTPEHQEFHVTHGMPRGFYGPCGRCAASFSAESAETAPEPIAPLGEALAALIAGGLQFGETVSAFAAVQDAEDGETGAYLAAAHRLHAEDGVCEIDDAAIVSEGDEGAYVMAWVWVSRDDAGIMDEDDEEDEDGEDGEDGDGHGDGEG